MSAWTWAVASRRGTSHERTGTKRQDAFRVVLSDDRRVLIAVACDGAGSAIKGGEGAAIAARTLSQCAKSALRRRRRQLDDSTIWEWIDLTRDRIAAAAKRRDLAPRDFATTVVMLISNGRSTTAIHIGDGAVVVRNSKLSEWQAICWPEHGEYASTTYFLTDDNEVRARIVRHKNVIDRFAVLTDGIERLALDFAASKPHEPFFTGISDPVARSAVTGCDLVLSAKLGAYLETDAINARTDDDKTLILACFA